MRRRFANGGSFLDYGAVNGRFRTGLPRCHAPRDDIRDTFNDGLAVELNRRVGYAQRLYALRRQVQVALRIVVCPKLVIWTVHFDGDASAWAPKVENVTAYDGLAPHRMALPDLRE
jgi:hypothetical protein